MEKDIDGINREFYDNSGDLFNKIPFEPIFPELFAKYGKGRTILEIGSGPGGLAIWLKNKGYELTCLEPSQKLAAKAKAKGLHVYPLTIQEFQTDLQYDCLIALSSLIHVPKKDLPAQINKLANMLKPEGIFFVSFLEGDNEGLEDPTKSGKPRYFAKWTEATLHSLFSPYFDLLETHRISNEKMNRTFLLSVHQKRKLLI